MSQPPLQIGPIAVDYPSPACARVRIGNPSERQTVFDEKTLAAFDRILTRIEALISLRGVIFTGCAPGRFIAGSDWKSIELLKTLDDALARVRQLQKLFDRIAEMPWHTVAAIDGPCLGAGLELALACKTRIVTDSPRTRLGFPEVLLGIIPGGGGTARLPRLIGFQDSLQWILSGKRFTPAQALKAGVADWVVAPADLDRQALEAAEGTLHWTRTRKHPLRHRMVDALAPARAWVARQSIQQLKAHTRGRYPAPFAAVRAVRDGLKVNIHKALEVEAQQCAELYISPQARELARIYILSDEARRPADRTSAENIQIAGVAGADDVGGEVAMLLAGQQIETRLHDPATVKITAALTRATEHLGKRAGQGRMTAAVAKATLLKMVQAPSIENLANIQFVVEAMGDSAQAKTAMVAALDGMLPREVCIASHADSIAISKLQESLRFPERVAGMHFFKPVDRMPVVEIVRGEKTDAATVALASGFALRLGKTPVIVRDGPGYLLHRILHSYFSEAARLLTGGLSIGEIDRAAMNEGMAAGPFALLDEFGIDAARAISIDLTKKLGERFHAGELYNWLVEARRMGRKSGEGFYKHSPEAALDPVVAKILGVEWACAQRGPKSRELAPEAGDRLMLAISAEARRALDSGIVDSADMLDLACVLGAGYPGFRGGPLRDFENRGAAGAARMQQFARQYGAMYQF